MGYQNSTAGTALTEAYLDEEAKQSVLNYATAAARNADAALSSACREGIVSYQADENTLKVQRDATLANVSTIGPVHGALTSWTPVVTQGATPTVTTDGSYSRVGRLIMGSGRIAVSSGTGTASNDIVVTLPVVASTTRYNTTTSPIGFATVFDSNASLWYSGALIWITTTTCKIMSANGTFNTYLGSFTFTAALASADRVDWNFCYEAGVDA